MEPKPISPHHIAAWKFDQLPFVDGPILSADDFEGDLNRWTAHAFAGSTAKRFALDESQPAEAFAEVSRKKTTGRNGKPSMTLAVQLPFPSEKHILMDNAVQVLARSYSEEYDIKSQNDMRIAGKDRAKFLFFCDCLGHKDCVGCVSACLNLRLGHG